MTANAETSNKKPGVDLTELSIAIVAGLALAFTTLFLCVVPFAKNITGSRDFVVFWATGKQLVHHANPFDERAMKLLESSAGLNTGYGVLYMRNPPWALPLALPLGFLSLPIGAFLWSFVIVGCLIASVLLLWKMHGRPANYLHWLGLSFGPALICAIMGQSTIFALLGYVLFLYLHRTRPFLAGVCLWLCALKPHLFVPFGVVLLVWVILSRSYKILAGAAFALAASCLITFLFDPTAWADYAQMMRAAGLDKEFIPSLVVVFRLRYFPNDPWIQYLAPLFGSIWAVSYYWPRRREWEWEQNGNLLVLVSLLAAPYSWVYDGGLAIPALLQGAYATRSKLLLIILSAASLLVEVELVCGIKITSELFLWTVPGWFAWYLIASATKRDMTGELKEPLIHSAR